MKQVRYDSLPFVPPEKLFSLLHQKPFFCWLDSCTRKNEGNYSVIGVNPFLIFRSKKNKITIEENGKKKVIHGDPLKLLSELLLKYKVNTRHFFSPGAMGYFSYDLGWHIEKLPDISVDDLNIPEIFLCFYDNLLVFDHKTKKVTLTSADFQNNYGNSDRFHSKTDEFKKLLIEAGNCKPYTGKKRTQFHSLQSNITHAEYVNAIHKIKDYIKAGDVYQINFAQRIQAEGSFSPEEIYLKLRSINPTSFSGFFNTGEFSLLSNSPELFLIKDGQKVLTRPMKGTRPRDKNKKQDSKYKNELLKSLKDKAELIMIVDLERNDIGKVCRYGSVRIKKLRRIESYKTVYHTTSTVEGIINNGIDCVDLLKATFPGGSITGAPKVRAMEIIEELEPNKRAFYTGSMGYLGFNGNIDLNILIRTILLKENKLYYPVGGGIVWDSTPEAEYEETITKAKALLLTLGFEENERKLKKLFA